MNELSIDIQAVFCHCESQITKGDICSTGCKRSSTMVYIKGLFNAIIQLKLR